MGVMPIAPLAASLAVSMAANQDAVAPLAPPGFFEHWLQESPLPTALVLVALAGAVGLLLARRGKARAGAWAAAGLVAAGVAVLVYGSLVTTAREEVMAETRAFVEAVVKGDAPAADRSLAPSLSVSIASRPTPELDRAAILSVVSAFAGELELRDHDIAELQARIVGPGLATTQVRVDVTPRRWIPASTWWRLEWRRDAAGAWRIDGMDCLLFNGRRPGPELAGAINRFRR